MTRFVSFPEGECPAQIPNLVLNLVDHSADVGAVSQLISRSLEPLDAGVAGMFNSDPLIDYRAQRPLMNFKNGQIVGMRREGIVLSYATDVEGQPFLRLHGTEPDFQWDALLADVLDVIERFGVKRTYSFTAFPAGIPHTRPAAMVVRTYDDSVHPVLEGDFWFPASFADYVEFHMEKLGVKHTNIAVRVPVYLANHQYSAGAASALGMASSLSAIQFPLGDLEQEAAAEADMLDAMMDSNEELASLVSHLEKEYDAADHSDGFITAPEPQLVVPTAEEIGRAAEQFLAGALDAQENDPQRTFDPQGLMKRFERYNNIVPRMATDGPRRGKHSMDSSPGESAEPGRREDGDAATTNEDGGAAPKDAGAVPKDAGPAPESSGDSRRKNPWWKFGK